jgi:hypothetical protein
MMADTPVLEAVWSTLHDGCMVAIEGTVPGDLRITVEIQYLCRYLPTESECIIVTLEDCTRFEYRPYEYPRTNDLNEIAALELEIIGARVAGDGVAVDCGHRSHGGELTVNYKRTRCSTTEGRVISQAELESAAERYWTDWEAKNKASPDENGT